VETELDALIQRADQADPVAADKLFRMLYHELHRLAEIQLRRANAAVTLGTTTLLHEAYLNISGRPQLSFPDRLRFLAYASRAMRGLIIDYARRRRARKRGSNFEVTLEGAEGVAAFSVADEQELSQLGDALDELAAIEPRLAELVDLHFFGGFSFTEIAGLRGVSDRTVQRDWRKARALLHRSILGDGEGEPAAG
jgi:RNA polymerase sigma factor (TIGR02999 family)